MSNTSLTTAQQNMVAEISPLLHRANSLMEKAKSVKVTDERGAANAIALKREITAHRTLVNQARLGITRQIDTVKKAIMDKESEILEPLQIAQDLVGDQVLAYQEEKERQRLAEIKRVDDLVDSVAMHSAYHLKTVAEVEKRYRQIRAAYADMSTDDQDNSAVKVAFTEAGSVLADRKAYLVEQARQEEERKKLDAQAAKQAAKQRRLDEQAAKAKRREAQEDAERQAQADRAEAERTARSQVKTGVRTIIDITITDSNVVPREYCVPDMALIRTAVKAGVAVPGVKVKKIKKL